MKWFLSLLLLISLSLAGCVGTLVNTAAPGNNITTPQTAEAIKTSTPTPVGTWETVIEGVIYDNSVGPDRPIPGATIRYHVLHSYFWELQEGRPNQTETDEYGEFSLPVVVHDTDRIRVLIKAQGYRSYEERLVGVDLFGGKRFIVGLDPYVAATAGPP